MTKRFTADDIVKTIFETAVIDQKGLRGLDGLAYIFSSALKKPEHTQPSLKVALLALRSQGMTDHDSDVLGVMFKSFCRQSRNLPVPLNTYSATYDFRHIVQKYMDWKSDLFMKLDKPQPIRPRHFGLNLGR